MQRVSIRTTMFLLVFLMTVMSLCLIVGMGLKEYDDDLRRAEFDSARLAYSIASEFRVLVNSAEELGETLSLLPDVQGRNTGQIEPLLAKLIAQSPIYANLVLLDHNGRAWASGVPMSGKEFTMADRRYFREVMATGRFSAGEYTLGKTTGKPVLTFGYPLTSADGKVSGCIAIGFDLEYFKQSFDKVFLPANASFLFLDHNGTVLFRPSSPELAVGIPYPRDEFRRMQQGAREQTGIGRGLDGTRRIISWIRLGLGDDESPYLYIKVSLPYDRIAGEIRRKVITEGSLLACIMVLGGVAIWFGGRRYILHPISIVRDAIRQVAEGDMGVRVAGRVNVRELQSVGQAFDGMVAQLAENIAERRQAEDEIRRMNNIFSAILSNAGAMVTMLDTNQDVVFWNKGAEIVTGFSAAEAVGGKQVLDSLYPDEDYRQKLAAIRQEVIAGRPVDDMPLTIRTKSGELRTISLYARPLLDDGGALMGMVNIAIDITERRKTEEQLRQSLKMESVGRLAGGVAHDFNNMLTIIIGYSEMVMQELSKGDPVLDSLQEILRAAERSRKITRQLLAFSRKELISPKVVDLNELITELGRTIIRLIGEDIHLAFRLASDLWAVTIDPSQVDQILVNLAVNARDAMPKGGNLTLTTSNVQVDEASSAQFIDARPGDYVQLSITDDGIGIDPQELEHIFEPFYTTKEVGKGTGMGLATVYGIVSQNQGFIQVDSRPDQGTVFTIYFPRAHAETAPEASPETKRSAGSGTILLVEDEEPVRRMTARMLEDGGYTVLQAESQQSALRLCENSELKIDLLLTDVIMPGLNGKELFAKIEAMRPGTRVVFMSGYTSDFIAQRAILQEDVHFIQKPFTRTLLAAKIQEALLPYRSDIP